MLVWSSYIRLPAYLSKYTSATWNSLLPRSWICAFTTCDTTYWILLPVGDFYYWGNHFSSFSALPWLFFLDAAFLELAWKNLLFYFGVSINIYVNHWNQMWFSLCTYVFPKQAIFFSYLCCYFYVAFKASAQ